MSPPELPPLGHAVSGAVAASLSNSIVYPLDLIVTRLQTQRRTKLTSDESQLYSSPFDALEKIYSNEGLGGLYSGWTHDTTASVASAFFYHFAYQFLRERRLKRAAARGDKTLGAVEELLVGSLAGVFSRFFTTPMNNLVTRKQTSGQISEDGKPASSASIIRDIYREKGSTGFWSGYRSSILLTLNPAITYYIFELFKSRFPPGSLQRGTRNKAHTSLETFLFAAVAKSIASTITYPFILAKARMQVSERRNLTPISVIRRIVREEGWQGLFKGLAGQIVKGFWSQGLLLMFKDRVGAVIIALYIRLYHYRQRGGDLNALLEEGKQAGMQYAQRAGLPVNMSDAKGLLESAADTAQRAVQHPAQTAEEVVEKVSDEVVKVAKTAREVLRGTSSEKVKEVVDEAVESAKGEVKGAFEQAKKK